MTTAEMPASLLDGTPYRARGVIAQGGMALVIDADRSGGRRVVVKVLRPDVDKTVGGLRERLLAEAEVLARLRHPNLVAVEDFGVTPRGEPYLVMERLEGQTLGQLIRERGALPEERALAVAQKALAGLGYAHQHGVVHRDVKPSNLFVCADDQVKVIDFGIAKLAPRGELAGMSPKHATAPGEVLGTPWYMAPEQLLGRAVTPATDIYALALVMYTMLCGRHPFATHRTAEGVWEAQLATMPPPVSSLCARPVSAAVDRAVLRALAKRPQDRFATAASFADALEREPAADARGLPTLAEEQPPPKRDAPPAAKRDAPPAAKRDAPPAAKRDAPPAAKRDALAATLASATLPIQHAQPPPQIAVVTAAPLTVVPTTPMPAVAAPMPGAPMPGVSAAHTPSRPVAAHAPGSPALHNACLVAAVVGIIFHGANAATSVVAAIDPASLLPGSEDLVRGVSAVALPRHALLFAAALALVVILLRARRDPQAALRRRRTWLGVTGVLFLVALVVDLAFTPLAAQYAERTAPLFAPYATTFAIALSLAAGALQLAVLALVSRWRPPPW